MLSLGCGAVEKESVNHKHCDGIVQERLLVIGSGPWKPNNSFAAHDKDLTKCRKCDWYSKLHAINTGGTPNIPQSIGHHSWCHACGRVASDQFMERLQSKPYETKEGDLSFGERSISFQIKSRDPRKMKRYQKNWEREGWVYDINEMNSDFFRNRIGPSPRIDLILASIPVMDEDRLPKNSAADEFEYILLENHSHVCLLQQLGACSRYMKHSIFASWDDMAQKGVREDPFISIFYILISSHDYFLFFFQRQ